MGSKLRYTRLRYTRPGVRDMSWEEIGRRRRPARSQMVGAGRDQEGATRVGTPRAAQNLIVSTTLLKLVAVPVATCDAHTVGYTGRARGMLTPDPGYKLRDECRLDRV